MQSDRKNAGVLLRYGGVTAYASPVWGEPWVKVPVPEAKLGPPRTRCHALVRAHLIRGLLDVSAPVVLVRAPAGYGKTTLLAQIAAADPQNTAWLSLDGCDNAPGVLVRELATATRRAEVGNILQLLNEMRDGEPMTLIVDNLEALRYGPSTDVLAALCSYLPPGWRLILAGRQAPGLPLARWRANGVLREVGAADLRLTQAEARRLVPAGKVDDLYERTEGWPAGLQLAGVERDERAIVAYFRDEVLSRLAEYELEFLSRTCSLDRFSPALCDAVLGTDTSGDIIDQLCDSGFLVPLDTTWFRYHHLFGEVLRRLASNESAIEAHARAAEWYAQHGMPADAVEQALAAGNHPRATALFAEHVRALVNTCEPSALRRWILTFSDADLAAYPSAAAGAAWVMGQLGERATARRCITILDHSDSTGPFPFGESSSKSAVALLKAAFGWEGVSQMRALSEIAYRLEPAGTQAHERSALLLGANLFLRGRLDAAQPYLEEAAVTDVGPDAICALGLLALLHLEARRLDKAESVTREGTALLASSQLGARTGAAAVLIADAFLSIDRDGPDAARVNYSRAEALLATFVAAPWWSILLATWSGRVAIALGDKEGAERALSHARRELGRYPDAGMLTHWVQENARQLDLARRRSGRLREPLTDAELRVLELVPTHLTLEEIGQNLCISRNTVKTHLKVIYGKLSVSSRSAAVARAQAVGLIGHRVMH